MLRCMEAFPVWLVAQRSNKDTFWFSLRTDTGTSQGAEATIDLERTFGTQTTWRRFLEVYRDSKFAPSAGELLGFGQDLLAWLLERPSLRTGWASLDQARGSRPLRLTLELDRATSAVAELPWELLAYDGQFFFTKQGSSLIRAFADTPALSMERLSQLRVLFAWACPEGQTKFDPHLHLQALKTTVGEAQIEELPSATLSNIGAALSRTKFDIFHLLAHGHFEDSFGGVVLHSDTSSGAAQAVMAQDLAAEIRGKGLSGAFLCSCQTAVGPSFTGTGQQLLIPSGADLSWVVASQANLAIERSEVLVRRFYELLLNYGSPGRALSQARSDAWPENQVYWSVPVLLARPERRGGQCFRPSFDLFPLDVPHGLIGRTLCSA